MADRFTDKDGTEFRIMPEKRARQLEGVESSTTSLVLSGEMQLRSLREENARLRSVLRFYADAKAWRARGFAQVVAALVDRGKRAREALGIR
jgi:hypothetical protein